MAHQSRGGVWTQVGEFACSYLSSWVLGLLKHVSVLDVRLLDIRAFKGF
jgi:hypothetical protein